MTKNYREFAKVVLRLIFVELKNRCFVYLFDGAKIDWVYDNFSEKRLIANIYLLFFFFCKIVVADDFHRVQNK